MLNESSVDYSDVCEYKIWETFNKLGTGKKEWMDVVIKKRSEFGGSVCGPSVHHWLNFEDLFYLKNY